MKMNQMIRKLRSKIVIDNTTKQVHLIESTIRPKNSEKSRLRLKRTNMMILMVQISLVKEKI